MAKVFGQPEPEEQTSNLPEQLRGKTPEEIYELTKAEHERVVNSLKAQKYDESSKAPEQGKPAQTQQRQAPQQQQGYQQGHQPTLSKSIPSEPTGAQKPVRYWEDPEGFLNQQLQQRLAPLVETQVNNLRETNRQLFEQQIQQNADEKEFYESHKDEVQDFMNALNPQIQADSRAYKKAYEYVKSQHLDEIIEKERTKSRTAGLAEALADAGMDPDQIAAIVAKSSGNAGNGNASQPDNAGYSSSLFQPTTGIPRTAGGSQSASSRASGDGGQKRGRQYAPEERRMMEEFGMTADEWEASKAENTDMYSNLGSGR